MNRDNQLVSIIQSGDAGAAEVESAWTELVAKFDAILLNHCTRFWHGNSTEAEHSAQNSWIKVFNNIHAYTVGTEGDEGNFYGWIVTVCKRECIDNFRKKRRIGVGEYIANPGYDPFTEEGRQQPKWIDRNISLDDAGSQNSDGADGQRDILGNTGAIEREAIRWHAEVQWLSGRIPSAEDELIEEVDATEIRYRNLIGRFLSGDESKFYQAYQTDENPKSNADKKRFFDHTLKLWRGMISGWLGQRRQLEEIMNQRQSDALTRRYSQRQNKSRIFKDMGLTCIEELESLLTSGRGLLLRAMLDETPDA